MEMTYSKYLATNRLDIREWQAINTFNRKARDFVEIRDASAPKTIRANIHRLDGGGFRGSTNAPSNEDLKLFYLSFRFFYLVREPSNFLKIRNLITRIVDDDYVKAFFNTLKLHWQRALSRDSLSDFLKKDIKGKEIIDLWFNSYFFHSDFNKEKRLNAMSNLLSEDISRYFLFSTVFSAGAPVGILYNSIKELAPNNLYLEVPDDFPMLE